jgi:SAM-dependent methyltransferase
LASQSRAIFAPLVEANTFVSDYCRFKRLASQSPARFPVTSWRDRLPCLDDNQATAPFDKHYLYHPACAARVLARTNPPVHVDISSILAFSSIVSAFIPIDFYDYRPAGMELGGLKSRCADLLHLPFANGELQSISCMHAIEHVGLGRYGDPLDCEGDTKAMSELKRVVKRGGDLLLVVPVGAPKIVFNAHRIYSFEQIIQYFNGFELIEFSLIPDFGSPEGMIVHAAPALVASQQYGCGCFWFRRM